MGPMQAGYASEQGGTVAERLTAFAREIARSLDLEAFFQKVVREAIVVVPSDIVWISIALTDGGPHRVVTAIGAPDLMGHVVEPGDGMIGTAIRDGVTVVRDRIDLGDPSPNPGTALPDRAMAGACAPILIDGNVAGTLGLGRLDLESPFDATERRSLELMASLAAVSLTNTVEFSEVLDRSIQDELTGVPNRRFFATAFEQLAAQRDRQTVAAREPVSAILFDLDHFGAVNKERGHATGDRVLAEFGRILTTRLRRADVVARYGGEEFVAVLVGTSREEATRVADEIRVSFGSSDIIGADGDPIHCTVSAGVAGVGADEASLEGLLPTADVALAMAKRAGRNLVATA
jgi:diguanylate cyclase (GGDEF)-like protein